MTLRPDYSNPAVRDGALLRTAADLLVPFGELGRLTGPELVEQLSLLGIKAATADRRTGYFWVEGACPGPEPMDEVIVLRSDGESWVVGYWERGSFRIDHRFWSEEDACRWLLHDLVSHSAISMGSTKSRPHVNERFRKSILAALDEVTALVRRGP